MKSFKKVMKIIKSSKRTQDEYDRLSKDSNLYGHAFEFDDEGDPKETSEAPGKRAEVDMGIED